MEKNQMQPTWIHAGDLRRHLKAHTGKGQTNAANVIFIQAGNLRSHLKAHSDNKPKKYNCDFSPIKADDLRNHFKIPPRHIQDRNLKDTDF